MYHQGRRTLPDSVAELGGYDEWMDFNGGQRKEGCDGVGMV